MKTFEFFQNTQLVFGAGKVACAGEFVRKFGKNCLLVTTSGSQARKAIYERIISILQASDVKVTHFDGVTPNPTTEDITKGAELARNCNAEIIVGLGGGSSMDAAKAIAVEATHEGTCWDYLFYKNQPTEKTLPVIAISTTSGTGSQVTQVAVVTNTKARDKSALYNNILFPKVSIIDPELMITTPSFVTATTGFDVLCHAFESILHPNCGAFVDLLSREAIQLVTTHLPTVLECPTDIKSRSAMAWADTLAGICIANSGVTLPHGMGMAIGGMYPHVAHGQALAIVYPACTAFTCALAVEQYAYLSRALDHSLQKVDDVEAARMAPDVLNKFLKNINLAQKLSDVNMPMSEIEDLAKQSMVLPDYQNNPKVATLDEMLELVTASY